MGTHVGRRRAAAIFAALVAFGARPPAHAQVPAGGPFFVAPPVTFQRQTLPAVVALPAGDFVVVWNRTRQYETSWSEVFVQRFLPDGKRRGAEFQVNTWTAYSQYARGAPPIAALRRLDFVVTWQDFLLGGRGRILGPVAPRTSELSVRSAGVAGSTDGHFVTVAGVADAGGSFDIEARLFDRQGNFVWPPFRVNTYTTGHQQWPAIAAGPDGAFVVVWAGAEDGGLRIHGQRLAADGTHRGAEFHVDQQTSANEQTQPAIAADADGGFVVAWEREGGIFARRFDPDGAPVAAEVRVDGGEPLLSLQPAVASDGLGNFVVTWSYGSFDDGRGIRARRFRADMTPHGGAFEVEPLMPWSSDPAVASDRYGNFMVTWDRTWEPLRYPTEVLARRYGGLRPAALEVDTAPLPGESNGNRVLEACETVDVRPVWSNINGQAQGFDGDVRTFTGPAGASYTLLDAAAGYGTVASGATGACQDCYMASVSCATTRPGTHWDATVIEELRPEAHGQAIRWPLHIGDSFTDVERDNPFYRFVETLLHRGVTSGCAPGTFCARSPVTREQMAVFLVTAAEGAGYRPAACLGTTGWIDVPPSSPFCPWVEDLTHRQVVSGCAIDRYCPADPVTREQMAVFVLRTAFPDLQPPACATSRFHDVPATSPFCPWIEELARRGVVGGCGGGRYCPANPVTREHMAVFLAGGFGLTLYGP